jgi:hypothetical protein
MIGDPISGLSDQRYFHVALVSSRTRDFGIKWVWNALRKDCKICAGRYKRTVFEEGDFEFKTAEESPLFAGSTTSREALATAERNAYCAYDVFGGSAGKLVMLGTGYAALTRVLVTRLVSRGLLSQAWFLVPRLYDIVDACRGGEDASLPMRFTITGFSAFIPGVKNLRVLRLGGADVFASGLVNHIERWLQTRGSEENGVAQAGKKEVHPLRYQAIRLKATGNLSGAAVSATLAGDGGCKMWLRKNAINLPEFGTAVLTLNRVGRFETTAEPPTWSEESEV